MHLITETIQNAGYYGYFILFAIVFLESFPLTFFLPGDSLLFTTGFLASQGTLSFPLLLATLFVGSVLGYIFSYVVGRKVGEEILTNKYKFFFNQKRIEKTREFFNKYGPRTIIFGRFVPIVRSFGPALAGAIAMRYSLFLRYNILGSIIWVGGVTSGGFFLGQIFPTLHLYLTPIVALIIVVSVLPTIIEYIATRKKDTTQA